MQVKFLAQGNNKCLQRKIKPPTFRLLEQCSDCLDIATHTLFLLSSYYKRSCLSQKDSKKQKQQQKVYQVPSGEVLCSVMCVWNGLRAREDTLSFSLTHTHRLIHRLTDSHKHTHIRTHTCACTNTCTHALFVFWCPVRGYVTSQIGINTSKGRLSHCQGIPGYW